MRENDRIHVGILFGGQSAEHEVSLQSALNVFEAIDRERYRPVLIAIDKKGQWSVHDSALPLLNTHDPGTISLRRSKAEISLIPIHGKTLFSISEACGQESLDVVFPILHGPLGEDGTVQGLLRLSKIPFVGADVLGSAIGMDKDIMKRLLHNAGLPIADYVVLRSHEPIPSFQDLAKRIGTPFFIKPANMGSSIAVSKVCDELDYRRSVDEAFCFDNKILFEQCIEGKEVECAVLGNENPIASVVGEVRSKHGFYSYEAKYLDIGSSELIIPANIPQQILSHIQKLSISTFQILECAGLARVDFFLQESGRVIINEINTMPGFTRISMYPKLWEASGIPYPDLIHRLINLALDRSVGMRKLKVSYY